MNSKEENSFVPITSKTSISGLARSRSRIHDQIHEHTISLRFLAIILRVLRLEVSVYNVYTTNQFPEAVRHMNGRFQMQGGKNWILPKEMNANRFFWDSHWLEIWSNHLFPSVGPNGRIVAMVSVI